MFTIPTTIILGAGASCGYGYPLGHELVSEIIKVCDLWYKLPKLYGEKYAASASELAKLLRFYDPPSIDAFLFHYSSRPDLLATAKQAITHILIRSASNAIFTRQSEDPKNHWYRFLWDAIVNGANTKTLANPRAILQFNIITFNYDPSLEYFLYSRVTAEDSMFDTEEQGSFLKKLGDSIHHVYGCISHYGWCGGPDDNTMYRDISHDQHGELVIKSCDRIKLITERGGDYWQIQEMIRWAQQVIFLGFAFDEINIGQKVLNLRDTLGPTKGAEDQLMFKTVKYTNLDDFRLINKKVEAVTTDLYHGIGNIELIKSTKTAYRAVSEDFSLHSLY